jgi:hypothetical protein
MTISTEEASARLADVDAVVARMKQSQIYRSAGDIFILWGALQAVRVSLFHMFPKTMAVGWFAVDFIGIVLTVLLLSRNGGAGARFPYRLAATFALFYGFGWIWADLIGDMHGRQLSAFWPTLFQFGWSVAGLWFGSAFLVIGLGALALTLASYFWGGGYAGVALTVVNSGALIAAGLWMRRA